MRKRVKVVDHEKMNRIRKFTKEEIQSWAAQREANLQTVMNKEAERIRKELLKDEPAP